MFLQCLGDIIVYDLAQGFKVIRVVANTSKGLDPVDSIGWSLDGLKLVTAHVKSVMMSLQRFQ